MNCLNIFLVDSRRDGAKAKVEAGTRAKSGPREPKIVKIGLFKALSPYVIASLGVKSPSGLLRVAKPHRRFL